MIGLGSLNQELRVHLNHWSCLISKVQSDHYLRTALVQQTRLLVEIKQTLDLLGLQALVLMEQYVYVNLSALAQNELNSVPREVLEDILAGTELYNQAVREQRVQHSATQLRTAVLQRAHYSTLDSSLPNSKGHHPVAFSIKELMMILAVHHADMAAKQLHCWASGQSYHICQVHTNQDACACSDNSVVPVARVSCGISTLRSEWTWKQLQHTYPISSPLFSINNHPHLLASSCHTYHKSPPVYIPDLHLGRTLLENHHPILAKPTFVQHRTEGSNKDQTSQCQTYISQTGSAQTSVEALDSVQPKLERQTSLENSEPLQTISYPSSTLHSLSALPLSGVCQQNHFSVELLFQLLVSSNDLLTSLVSHTPTPEEPTEQLLPDTITHVLSPNGKTDLRILPDPIIHTDDSVELNRLSTELKKDQNMEGTQQEWAELGATARPEASFR